MRCLHVPSVAAGPPTAFLVILFFAIPHPGAVAWRRPPYPLGAGRRPVSRRLLAVWVERGGTRCCCSSSTAGCWGSDSTRPHSTCCSSCHHGSGAVMDLPRFASIEWTLSTRLTFCQSPPIACSIVRICGAGEILVPYSTEPVCVTVRVRHLIALGAPSSAVPCSPWLSGAPYCPCSFWPPLLACVSRCAGTEPRLGMRRASCHTFSVVFVGPKCHLRNRRAGFASPRRLQSTKRRLRHKSGAEPDGVERVRPRVAEVQSAHARSRRAAPVATTEREPLTHIAHVMAVPTMIGIDRVQA